MLLCELKIKFLSSFIIIHLLIRYGFYGDVITESEKYRWMGPKRYDYAGTKVFLRHRYGFLMQKWFQSRLYLQFYPLSILLMSIPTSLLTDIVVCNAVFNGQCWELAKMCRIYVKTRD